MVVHSVGSARPVTGEINQLLVDQPNDAPPVMPRIDLQAEIARPMLLDMPAEASTAVAPRTVRLRGDSGVDDDIDVDAERLQSVIEQLTPTLTAELSFANRVCRFDDATRRRLIDNANEQLVRYARQQSHLQVQAQGVVQWMNRGRQVEDPRAKIAQVVSELVVQVATAAEASAYQAEIAARQQFEAEAVVGVIVARMDERLTLSAEQQETISRLLLAGDRTWLPPLESLLQIVDYLPQVPEGTVREVFDADQRSAWKAMPKVSFANAMLQQDLSWIDGGLTIDDIDLGERREAVGPIDDAADAARDSP